MNVTREQAKTWAGWFTALSDPTRILVLNILATERRSLSVGELVERVDVGQSTVSHHLRVLSESCFVFVEPAGTSNLYRINQECLECFPSTAELIMGNGPRTAPWAPAELAEGSIDPRRPGRAAERTASKELT